MCQYAGIGYGCGHNELQRLSYCHPARIAFRHVCLRPANVTVEWDMPDESCPTCIQNGAPQHRSEEPEPLMEEPRLRDPVTPESLRQLANLEREEQQRIMQNRLGQQEDEGSAADVEGSASQSAYAGVIDIPPFQYPATGETVRRRNTAAKDDDVEMDMDEAEPTKNIGKQRQKVVGRKLD